MACPKMTRNADRGKPTSPMAYYQSGEDRAMPNLLPIMVSLAAHAGPTTLLQDLSAWRAHRMTETAPAIPASAYQSALNGEIASGIEVVPEVKAAKGYGVSVVNAPIATVWKAVADEDHHANALPISQSMTVQGRARSPDHTVFQYMNVPLLTDRWWLVRIRYNSNLYAASGGRAWELVWEDRLKDAELRSTIRPELVEDGMPIAWSKGAWLLVDLGDGRTLIEYHTWSDPGGNVPAGPASRFAAGEVKNNLRSIADFARRHTPTCGGTYVRPDGTPL